MIKSKKVEELIDRLDTTKLYCKIGKAYVSYRKCLYFKHTYIRESELKICKKCKIIKNSHSSYLNFGLKSP